MSIGKSNYFAKAAGNFDFMASLAQLRESRQTEPDESKTAPYLDMLKGRFSEAHWKIVPAKSSRDINFYFYNVRVFNRISSGTYEFSFAIPSAYLNSDKVKVEFVKAYRMTGRDYPVVGKEELAGCNSPKSIEDFYKVFNKVLEFDKSFKKGSDVGENLVFESILLEGEAGPYTTQKVVDMITHGLKVKYEEFVKHLPLKNINFLLKCFTLDAMDVQKPADRNAITPDEFKKIWYLASELFKKAEELALKVKLEFNKTFPKPARWRPDDMLGWVKKAYPKFAKSQASETIMRKAAKDIESVDDGNVYSWELEDFPMLSGALHLGALYNSIKNAPEAAISESDLISFESSKASEAFNFRKEGGPSAERVLANLVVTLGERYRFGKVMDMNERAALCIETLRGMGMRNLQYTDLNESAIREKVLPVFELKEKAYGESLYCPEPDYAGVLARLGIVLEAESSAPQEGDKRLPSLKDYGKDYVKEQEKKNKVYLNKLNGIFKAPITQKAEVMGESLIWSFFIEGVNVPLLTVSFELAAGRLSWKALLDKNEISSKSVEATEWNTADKIDEALKKVLEGIELKNDPDSGKASPIEQPLSMVAESWQPGALVMMSYGTRDVYKVTGRKGDIITGYMVGPRVDKGETLNAHFMELKDAPSDLIRKYKIKGDAA
jgi:hypothetical protein